jgi:hypothetical protein
MKEELLSPQADVDGAERPDDAPDPTMKDGGLVVAIVSQEGCREEGVGPELEG